MSKNLEDNVAEMEDLPFRLLMEEETGSGPFLVAASGRVVKVVEDEKAAAGILPAAAEVEEIHPPEDRPYVEVVGVETHPAVADEKAAAGILPAAAEVEEIHPPEDHPCDEVAGVETLPAVADEKAAAGIPPAAAEVEEIHPPEAVPPTMVEDRPYFEVAGEETLSEPVWSLLWSTYSSSAMVAAAP